MYLEWVGAGSADGDHLRDLAGLALGQSIAELKVAVIGLGYGQVTTGGIHQAKSIRVAEAAKVVENTQRDLNIAFMNQLAQGFDLMDISIWDVLETAGTKWNFLKFRPGMVGGHCIGVDPYYLIHRVNELNGSPSLISEARHVNEGMAKWLAERVDRTIARANAEILVLGATFKPDVPDVRNSKVPNFIRYLEGLGHRVTCHDPHADPLHARHHLGIEFDREALGRTYDFVVLAVPHQEYLAVLKSSIANLCRQGGAILDVTGQLKDISADPRIRTLM